MPNTRVTKDHTVDSLKTLNNGRFWRRVDTLRISDYGADCWIWISTRQKKSGSPWFWVQTLEGRQLMFNAKRYAWNMERAPLLTNPNDILLCICENKGEADAISRKRSAICVNPWHYILTDRSNWRMDRSKALGERPPGIPKSEEEFLKGGE